MTEKRILPAFLLAFFLGAFGAHNFYLGQKGKAIAQLVLSIVGILTSIIGIGIFLCLATGIWAFVEMIMIACGAGKDGEGVVVKQWT